MRILDEKTKKSIVNIKELLIDFHGLLKDQLAGHKDLDLLKELILQIDDLFLLVVAGEYNSGKSAFINALLGGNYLETGITPTTSTITVVKYGDKEETIRISKDQTSIFLPINQLKDVSIVDTPGTNAILREHEEITNDFIPRSDLVLFVTSVDRSFTESEKLFLEKIRDWGKKIIFIINKTDILDSEETLSEVKEYITTNARSVLGIEPIIFSLSSKNSLDHKNHYGESEINLKNIENFVTTTLGSEEYISLKFANPLGVIEKLISKYSHVIDSRIEILASDFQLIEDIDNQLKYFKNDIMNDFRYRYAEIDNALLEFEKRGTNFFDNTFRFARIIDLINKERIQSEYQDAVVKGLSFEIDNKVNGLIDWLVGEDLRQWQAITQKIDERSVHHHDRVFEDKGSRQIRFERQQIVEKVKHEAQKIIEHFNRNDEARKIAEEAQMSVAASAAIEAGALGLGAIVTILATTASADITGVMLAGLTAAIGLFIIPAKKKNIKSTFSKNVIKIRKELSEILNEEFERQVNNIINHVEHTISPYRRFIQSEKDNLLSSKRKFSDINQQVFSIRDTLLKK